MDAEVVIQHNSMQFSDSPDAHRHDAKVVFDTATDTKAWAVTGTESGDSRSNHDLRDFLVEEAHDHEFYIFAHKYGEWVALNRRYLKGFEHGYDGPYIKGSVGIDAAHGAHAPRGVTWVSASPIKFNLGLMSFGAAHYLTKPSMAASHVTNEPLVRGIAAWGVRHGNGPGKIAIFCADTNMDDLHRDVFMGKPFTSISDELGKHPATHGANIAHGAKLDVIASYDFDGRVKAKSYTVWDDSKVKLYADHFMLHGVYSVAERREKA